MNKKYLKLKVEVVVNKLLYEKNIIDNYIYEETAKKIDKLLYDIDKNRREV